jgi:hypothetical protein
VDLSTYPTATYGIYVRFETVPAEAESRIFWNPTNSGFEYAKTINTRYAAKWSVRAEITSPGAEWMKIGEIVRSTMVITDQRNFFFEGQVSAAYASGWGTEGGGAANDRSADRASYGSMDLQTFTGSVRQCLEDIKGRGLRRWWSREVGGLIVGYDADPDEDQIRIGDAYFRLDYNTGNPRLSFDTSGYWKFARGTSVLTWVAADVDQAWISPGGILNLGDANFSLNYNAGSPAINLDADTYISFDRDSNILTFGQVSIGQMWLRPTGDLRLGDDTFKIAYNGASPLVQFDTGDTLVYDRAGALTASIGSSVVATFTITKLAIGPTVNFALDYNAGNPKAIIGVPGDGGFYLSYGNGSFPAVVFAPNDYLTYNVSLNLFSFIVGDVSQMTFRGAGDLRIWDDDFSLWYNSNSPMVMFSWGNNFSLDRMLSTFIWRLGYQDMVKLSTSVLGAKLSIGDANYSFERGDNYAGDPRINLEPGSLIYYSRVTNVLQFWLGNSLQSTLSYEFYDDRFTPVYYGTTLGVNQYYSFGDIFTQNLTITNTAPVIKIEDTDADINYKKTWFGNFGNYFILAAANDAETALYQFLQFDRDVNGQPVYVRCYASLQMSAGSHILSTINGAGDVGTINYGFASVYAYAIRNAQGGLALSTITSAMLTLSTSGGGGPINLTGQVKCTRAVCSAGGDVAVPDGYLGINGQTAAPIPGAGEILSGGKPNHAFLMWKMSGSTIWIPYWDAL